MVLPFEPHSITFDEIRYAVDMPQVYMMFLDMNKAFQKYVGLLTKHSCANLIDSFLS